MDVLTPAGSRQVDKNLTQTWREDRLSCLIKQRVYEDSCQRDANTQTAIWK